ncbi:MAG: alpha-N-arabinofuranosidase [Tannerella sp.]|nr:alpha-N-arabinofuranosidase [Tannerella sp.]
MAQNTAVIKLHPSNAKDSIPRAIYGQFAEHLGRCIYGGLWVGESSTIKNTHGYRTDVLQALKDLKVPVLRWPGGCFADEYHWMDGVGRPENRPRMVNNNWGGTVEDNSFGTHEFLNLCELLGCEPYISGNVGSGTVEEMAKWVEYMTSDGDSPMAKLRRENGRDRAWKVRYIGVGNESWGCGGDMRPEYYADLYRRYAVYCRNYDGNRLYKVASGASDYDFNWTDVLMKNIGNRMNALSVHYYTCKGWNGSKGSATAFNSDEYYRTLQKCLDIENVIRRHCEIMDKYDPGKRIALLVDEWGTWWDEEPGTVSGHLYQQNTLRDAFVASLTFDVFHKYISRVKMANIAQIVNVLQSMILTDDSGRMALTPTYHVFKMYSVHQDALHIPASIVCDVKSSPDHRTLPLLSATASIDRAGLLHISLTNIDADNAQSVSIDLSGLTIGKQISATILTSPNLTDHNTFDHPQTVSPAVFKDFALISPSTLQVNIPAKSIITVELSSQRK